MLDLSGIRHAPLTYDEQELEEIVARLNGRRGIAELVNSLNFGHIDLLFERFVGTLSNLGYQITSLDDDLACLERTFSFRYDVHIHDIIAAYKIAQIHERMKLPGVFYLTWDFTDREHHLRRSFQLFKEFDPAYVQLGLHAAPFATWFIAEKFLNNRAKARRFIESDALLVLAKDRKQIDAHFASACEMLRTLACSFRGEFGAWKTVTGHGNVLSSTFYRRLAKNAQFSPLGKLFHPVQFFGHLDVRDYGFVAERTNLGKDEKGRDIMLFDGSLGTIDSVDSVRKRFADRSPVAITIHPALWTALPIQDFMNRVTGIPITPTT